MKQVKEVTHFKNADGSVYAEVNVFEEIKYEGDEQVTRTLVYSYIDGVKKDGATALSEVDYKADRKANRDKFKADRKTKKDSRKTAQELAVSELEKAGVSRASAVIIVYGRNV